jgi:hypothetical protein
MTSQISAFAAQDDNGIPTAIEVTFGIKALHFKATLNAFLLVRVESTIYKLGLG